MSLEQSQDLIKQVFTAAADGIVVVDRAGFVLLCNPAAERLTGWKQQEILGRLRHEAVHYAYRDGTPYPVEQCPIHRCALTGEPTERDTEVFWRKDGSSFPVWYRAYPIHDGDERTGAVEVFRDLTDDRAVEAANRRIREIEMAQRIAFEINDTVVQRLAVADMALELGRLDQGKIAVHEALGLAKQLINEWAGEGNVNLTRNMRAAHPGQPDRAGRTVPWTEPRTDA